MKVETFTPVDVMQPIGPYSHIACVGPFVWISATAGVDATTGQLAGNDTYAQAQQILKSFRSMLQRVGSSLDRVAHVTVYLKRMEDFEAMNRAYAEAFGLHRPARSVVAVANLPKANALLTMNLQAVRDELGLGKPS